MRVRLGMVVLGAFVSLVVTACGRSADDATVESSEPVEELAFDSSVDDGVTVIGVVNLTSITALDLLYEGFEEGISACSTSDAIIDYRNANGDGSLLRPYADGLLADDVDLILAITTPALQATAAANVADGEETPVLFGAVTDPYTAGVATDATNKPSWMTGWRTNADVEPLFDLAAEIRDPLSSIGVVYNPDQVNSTLDVGKMQAIADGLEIDLIIVPVPDQNAIEGAANELAADQVDVIFVPNDIVVVAGLGEMTKVADDRDIPIISLAPDSVYDGAAVGIGLDYRGDGGRLAKDACDILDGAATADELPIRSQREQLVFFSPSTAEAQGFSLPDRLIQSGFDVDAAEDPATASG